MGLSKTIVNVDDGIISGIFSRIQKKKAPEIFTAAFLKQIGFNITRKYQFICMLKDLGFLTKDGKPTNRYFEYQNKPMSAKILGDAIREKYSILFSSNIPLNKNNRHEIKKVFQNFHSVDTGTAYQMARTFLDLLYISDIKQELMSNETFLLYNISKIICILLIVFGLCIRSFILFGEKETINLYNIKQIGPTTYKGRRTYEVEIKFETKSGHVIEGKRKIREPCGYP